MFLARITIARGGLERPNNFCGDPFSRVYGFGTLPALDPLEVSCETPVSAQIIQISVRFQMLEVVVPAMDGLLDGPEGFILIVQQRITAGEVVKDDRVAGAKLVQPLVHFQALPVETVTRVEIPQRGQDLDEVRFLFQDPFIEPDLKIPVVDLFFTVHMHSV